MSKDKNGKLYCKERLLNTFKMSERQFYQYKDSFPKAKEISKAHYIWLQIPRMLIIIPLFIPMCLLLVLHRLTRILIDWYGDFL